jgi:phosphate transport system permease protein
VARVSGETAPLLFTALNSPFHRFFSWNLGLNEPYPNLTVTIFDYAMSPYPDWQMKAWGASLVITVGILCLTVFARWLFRERKA